MQISTVGVIGAGTMGNGIAQVSAAAGLSVIMVDVAQAGVDRGLAAIATSLDRRGNKRGVCRQGGAGGRRRPRGDREELGSAGEKGEAVRAGCGRRAGSYSRDDGVRGSCPGGS